METCRELQRGRQAPRGTETWSGVDRCRDAEGVVPEPHVVGKNWGGYLRNEGY